MILVRLSFPDELNALYRVCINHFYGGLTTHVLPITIFEETDFIPKQPKTSGRTAPVYMILVQNSRSGSATGVNSHRYDIFCWYHVHKDRATGVKENHETRVRKSTRYHVNRSNAASSPGLFALSSDRRRLGRSAIANFRIFPLNSLGDVTFDHSPRTTGKEAGNNTQAFTYVHQIRADGF